ncbi:MAG TPA: DUF6600 domain-containing protein [Terriglobales bacterium]|nr:DUF6600 domain-containing protein [Terriglobales bacterium]
MKTRTGFSLAVLATAILLLCSMLVPAFAQDQDVPMPPNADQQYDQGPDQPNDQTPEQDPPTRAGRISYTEGSVSFQPGGQGDWVDAVMNRPLTVGDNLWVDKDSRAEIQIGGTSIRLGPETSVTFLALDDNTTQLRLSLGSLFVRVRHFDRDDNFEIDTPNLAFNVDEEGQYRLDVNQNGDQTAASVWRGAAEITGAGNSYRLSEGQQGTFSGTDQLAYDVGEIPQADSFTQWCLSRDQREDQAQSRQYVSDDMTGYEDLDEYGSWDSDADYGHVWYPRGVAVDWAPYRYGHWAYVYPWGWTWVEDEPWGFAPFHYGRWAFVRSRWCWVPGPVAVRPVYAPALVAFVGGFSISVGTAPVGWFPLAPREVYVPWYRTSPRYVQNVNITNTRVTVVQVTNVYHNYTVNHVTNVTYVNRRVNNSVTVVNRETFINARPVRGNIVRMDSRQLASARVSPAVVTQVRPARQSVIGAARPVKFRPPAQALSRPVVATRQPTTFHRPTPSGASFVRPAAPPPVRTVQAAPRGQAQPLQRGARGGQANNAGRPGGQPNNAENRGGNPRPGAPANQPNAPENRGAAPRPGAPANQPNAQQNGRENRGPENRGPENRNNVPRPGAPNNQPNAPENRGAAPRPGGPVNQPNTPENRGETPRPGSPNNATPNNAGPNNAPTNNGPANRGPMNNPNAGPPNHNVPRPPSANPQGGAPEQQPTRQYPGTRPENNRPENVSPAQPSRQPDMQQNRPEPPQTRAPETPQVKPEQPARTPNARQEPSRQPEVRTPPQTRQPEQEVRQPRPNMERNNPRPEARPAAPPRENRAPAPRNEKPRDEKPPKDHDHSKRH